MYRDISPDILDNWLGGPKNGILTVWHKMIPASAMLVLVLERMRVSPSSWGEGGGVVRDLPPQTPLRWCINSDQTDRIRGAMSSYLANLTNIYRHFLQSLPIDARMVPQTSWRWRQSHQGIRANGGTAPVILNLGTRCRSAVSSISCPGCFLIFWRRHKPLASVGNRTTIPRSSIAWSSRYAGHAPSIYFFSINYSLLIMSVVGSSG